MVVGPHPPAYPLVAANSVFLAQPWEQILNETDAPPAGTGWDEPVGGSPRSVGTGLAVVVDLAAQAVQFSVTMVILLALAGTLCVGLILSARQFSQTVRESRAASQKPASIQSQAGRLRSIARNPETMTPREQLLRQIEAASRQLDVEKLTALRGQLQKLLDQKDAEVAPKRSQPAPAVVP